MLTLFNSKERTIGDWKQILEAASTNFYLEDVSKVSRGSGLALLKIRWRSQQA